MEPTERWTPQVASDFYDVASWGKGYFSVGDNGHVLVHPEKDPARSIDLKQLVDTLVLRGINLPILVRFADIPKRLGMDSTQILIAPLIPFGYETLVVRLIIATAVALPLTFVFLPSQRLGR